MGPCRDRVSSGTTLNPGKCPAVGVGGLDTHAINKLKGGVFRIISGCVWRMTREIVTGNTRFRRVKSPQHPPKTGFGTGFLEEIFAKREDSGGAGPTVSRDRRKVVVLQAAGGRDGNRRFRRKSSRKFCNRLKIWRPSPEIFGPNRRRRDKR